MKQKTKPKGSIVAALDIGSSKIACFIARVIDESGIRLLQVSKMALLRL
jgi:cell division protein FtsA